MEVELPSEQASAYQSDYDDCVSSLPTDFTEVTEESAELTFDNNLRVLDCLEDAGYSTEDAPNRDSYIQQVLEDPKGVTWDPYALVPLNDRGNAITKCPQ